jgi:hypothetical protein
MVNNTNNKLLRVEGNTSHPTNKYATTLTEVSNGKTMVVDLQ